MSTPENLKQTSQVLTRIQNFDPKTLARTPDLGRELNFEIAVIPAERLVELYKRIPISILDDLTDSQLNTIKNSSQTDYNVFHEVMTFSAARSDAAAVRTNLITNIQSRRDQVFNELWNFIAYGVARVTDTSLLEAHARSTLQEIRDQGADLTKKLQADKDAADAALNAIRSAAAEQGVSQQAEYFKKEADQQEAMAGQWLKRTYQFATAVATFAVISVFLHKIPFLKPESLTESIQLVSSKILIFTVLIYMLVLTTRNFASNKHNAVINRHRQNALLTFRALTSAAADKGTEDIILANAAACIFSPQDTSYSGGSKEGGSSGGGSKSVLELLTRSKSGDAA